MKMYSKGPKKEDEAPVKTECNYQRCTEYKCALDHSKKTLQTPHLSREEFESRVKAGKAFRGKIDVQSPYLIFVRSQHFRCDIFIKKENLNCAFTNEEVGFEIFFPQQIEENPEVKKRIIGEILLPSPESNSDLDELASILEEMKLEKKSSSLIQMGEKKEKKPAPAELEEEKIVDQQELLFQSLKQTKPEARVVYIDEKVLRQRKPLFGRIEPTKRTNNFKFMQLINSSKLVHDIIIPLSQQVYEKDELSKSLFKIQIVDWSYKRSVPEVTFEVVCKEFFKLEELFVRSGKTECFSEHVCELQAKTTLYTKNSYSYWQHISDIILEEKFDQFGYSKEALEEVQVFIENRKQILEEELKKRADLRDMLILTIDCKETVCRDDALSVEELPNGNYKVGIHISDASFYIKEGSVLDKEARKKSTNIYMKEAVYRMVPDELSIDLASLSKNQELLCFSLFLELDKNGNMAIEACNVLPVKSIINPCSNFSYDEADEILLANEESASLELLKEHTNEKFGPASVLKTLRNLATLGKHLHSKRRKTGVADIIINDFEYILEPELLAPEAKRVAQEQRGLIPMQEVVQEFMLLANYSIGQLLNKRCPHLSLKKRVFIPSKETAESLNNYFEMSPEFRSQPLRFNFSSPELISESMKKILESTDLSAELKCIILVKFKFSLSAAVIGASEINKGSEQDQFAVSSDFTSPLRRYFDLLVHRVLNSLLETEAAEKNNFTASVMAEKLGEIAEKLKLCKEVRRFFEETNKYTEFLTKIEAKRNEAPSISEQNKPILKERGIVLNAKKDHFEVFIPLQKIIVKVFFKRGEFCRWEKKENAKGEWILARFYINDEEMIALKGKINAEAQKNPQQASYNAVKAFKTAKYVSSISTVRVFDQIDVEIALERMPDYHCKL